MLSSYHIDKYRYNLRTTRHEGGGKIINPFFRNKTIGVYNIRARFKN